MLNNREIIKMCEVLAEQENLRVTINESIKCGFYAGCGALVGGIFGGPIGVALGIFLIDWFIQLSLFYVKII